MSTKHNTREICPRCEFTLLEHVHCAYLACTFMLLVCPSCDKQQAVDFVMTDHEEDCATREVEAPQPTASFVRARSAA